jgi:hypothetical protein
MEFVYPKFLLWLKTLKSTELFPVWDFKHLAKSQGNRCLEVLEFFRYGNSSIWSNEKIPVKMWNLLEKSGNFISRKIENPAAFQAYI